jgi:hypothetical protein
MAPHGLLRLGTTPHHGQVNRIEIRHAFLASKLSRCLLLSVLNQESGIYCMKLRQCWRQSCLGEPRKQP